MGFFEFIHNLFKLLFLIEIFVVKGNAKLQNPFHFCFSRFVVEENDFYGET